MVVCAHYKSLLLFIINLFISCFFADIALRGSYCTDLCEDVTGTVEPHYNEVPGTMKLPCYIRFLIISG